MNNLFFRVFLNKNRIDMKRLIFILIALLTVAASGFGQTKYTADPSATILKWKGTKVLGEHVGTIALKDGWINWKRNSIVSGSFEINMSSLKDEDQKDDKMRNMLENHLKSDDFFGVEKFPLSTLEINTPTAFRKGKAYITADLTIKGIKQPISFYATVKDNGNELVFTAPITVDRTKYGLKYGSGKFFSGLGDKAISDEFTLDVTLIVKK
jgi:polyisoprenoid-binding protein YceI